MGHLHTSKFTVAHALGFSLSTSRFSATDPRHTNYNRFTFEIVHINQVFHSHVNSTVFVIVIVV
jgi:hypothetical protein